MNSSQPSPQDPPSGGGFQPSSAPQQGQTKNWSPTAASPPETASKGFSPSGAPAAPKTPELKRLPITKILIALALIAGGLLWTAGPDNAEEKSPNWARHEQAGQGPSGKIVNQTGTRLSSLPLGTPDLNRSLQSQARAAATDPGRLAQLAQSHQGPNVTVSPSACADLAPKIANDQLKFYTIQVWDTCAEDGDVVDIIVDGVVFASVALKHAPTSVSIPCGEGSSIGIGATHDGGGGVTLGVSTSAGQFFTPILRPGETLPLGVSF